LSFFNKVVERALQLQASDIHIGAGSPVRLRIGGRLVALEHQPLTPDNCFDIARAILGQAGRPVPVSSQEFLRSLSDEDCSYSVPGLGRFRVNVSLQRGTVALVLRAIPHDIPTLESLGLPQSVRDITMEERGLVLVTGITGSGKSTTLASMVSHLNDNRPCKIVTIEDPIEFMHRDRMACIMQREVGSDTVDFARAMRAALRQDPDVILVGEMRDRETMDIALKAGETGHLVLSTVHTTDAPKTINRLLSFFDPAEQMQLRLRLADSLKAIISQRLLVRADGNGRVPAVEILRSTASIRECISSPEKTVAIMDFIASGRSQYGMQTFDQHLMELFETGVITVDVARAAATCPSDFERNLTYV